MHGEVLTATSPCTPDRSATGSAPIPVSTSLRDLVLSTLRERREPTSVYALLATINGRTGTRRYANSIYRILNYLVAADLVIHVVSWKRYMARPRQAGPMPLLLLCRLCEKVEVGNNPQSEHDIGRLVARARFGLRTTHLEIAGTCRRCRTD